MIYDNIEIKKNIVKTIAPQFSINFIDGAYVELFQSEQDKKFRVQMILDDNLVHYQSYLSKGMWSRSGIKYYKDWTIKIFDENDQEILTHKFNLKGKRVFIAFDSKALGDNLAWIPYVEVFKKKHDCELIVSTFHNKLFQDQYQDIKFVEPGEVVYNLYAMYKIGWYYEGDEYKLSNVPRDFKNYPLQQTICDILNLEFEEIVPKICLKNNIQKKKKVGIGIHSTCQAKYWNNPIGWQEVVGYLKSLGYEVVLYSRENDGHMGNYQPNGITKFNSPNGTLPELIDDLASCEFYIGLGSGLSWLAWSCNLPIVLISGFSKPFSEMKKNVFRVINEDVCNGCFNSHRLNPSDWNWCPLHKGTPRHFECTKKISHSMVIQKINELLETTSV